MLSVTNCRFGLVDVYTKGETVVSSQTGVYPTRVGSIDHPRRRAGAGEVTLAAGSRRSSTTDDGRALPQSINSFRHPRRFPGRASRNAHAPRIRGRFHNFLASVLGLVSCRFSTFYAGGL